MASKREGRARKLHVLAEQVGRLSVAILVIRSLAYIARDIGKSSEYDAALKAMEDFRSVIAESERSAESEASK